MMTAPDYARGGKMSHLERERERNKYSLSNIHVVDSGSPSVKESDLQDQCKRSKYSLSNIPVVNSGFITVKKSYVQDHCPSDLQVTEIVQGSLSLSAIN